MSIDINNLVAGGRVNSSISVARDGYTALGVVGVNPNVWGVTAEGLSISDGKTLRYRVSQWKKQFDQSDNLGLHLI